MSDSWFYSGPAGKVGPRTFQAILEAVAAHPHANDLYIWRDGWPEWVRVGDLGGVDQIRADTQLRRKPMANGLNIGNYSPKEENIVPTRRHFSISGVLVGVLLIMLGCLVFYLGMIGEFTLVTKILDLNGEEINAASGAVLIIAGLIVTWATRYEAAH